MRVEYNIPMHQEGWNGNEGAVRRLRFLTLTLVVATLGWLLWSRQDPLVGFLIDYYELSDLLTTVGTAAILIALGGWSAAALQQRKRSAALLTVLAWMVSLSTGLILIEESLGRTQTLTDSWFAFDLVTSWKQSAFVALALAALLRVVQLFAQKEETEGFGSWALAGGRVKRSFWARALLIGTGIWYVLHLGALDLIVTLLGYARWGFAEPAVSAVTGWLEWGLLPVFGPHLNFWIPAAIAIGWLTMECVVDAEGVRIRLRGLGIRIAGLPWADVGALRLLLHGSRPPSAILLPTKGRFWKRFTVHGRHYEKGREAIAAVVGEAENRGIPIQRYYSSPWVPRLAYLCLLVAAGLMRYQYYRQIALMEWFLQDDFALGRFGELGSFVSLGMMTAIAAALVGWAAGLLSAYHNASPRPFLLALLILVSVGLPTPDLFWLVYFAVYAILVSIVQPVVPLETVTPPSASEMNIGISLVQAVPLLVGVGYILGVWAGHRRARSGEEMVGVPARLSPQPKASAGAQQAG